MATTTLEFLLECYRQTCYEKGHTPGPVCSVPTRVLKVKWVDANEGKTQVCARVKCHDGAVRTALGVQESFGGETVWDPRDTYYNFHYV